MKPSKASFDNQSHGNLHTTCKITLYIEGGADRNMGEAAADG